MNLVVKLNKSCSFRISFDSLEIKNSSKPFWAKYNQCISKKHSKGDSDTLLNSSFLPVTGWKEMLWMICP